ncbi:MAG: NAD(P)-dependent oxidoreductase, partial [Armatimonadota bacterium]|nr:NAD(P)-dependent oxidoreductase [Armatimonadota bacterium]
MEARPRILVADGLSEVGLRRLREAAEVEVHRSLDEAALRERIRGVDALIVRSQTRVTASVFQAADRLRVVARAGVGTDNVDVEAATRAGVLVLNTPEASVRATAEHTLALLLALCRNIPQANAALREGEWARERFVGTELYGKTLGIVGLGRIGSEVARRAQAFGMRVIAHDPYLSDDRAAQLGVTLVPFEILLRESD